LIDGGYPDIATFALTCGIDPGMVKSTFPQRS